MSLYEMLTLVAMWCGEDALFSISKIKCQQKMSVCIKEELKKNEKNIEPIFIRCWTEMLKR